VSPEDIIGDYLMRFGFSSSTQFIDRELKQNSKVFVRDLDLDLDFDFDFMVCQTNLNEETTVIIDFEFGKAGITTRTRLAVRCGGFSGAILNVPNLVRPF
jgi:hypothetical protein